MNHISTLQLHRLRLGELAPEERAPLDAHLDTCAVCARRAGHQVAARAAFVQTPVPPAISALDRPTRWQRLGAWRAALALVPVAAAAVFAVRLSPAEAPARVEPAEEVRLKGARPTLEAWIQTGESARPVYAGERVAAGSKVQLKVDAGGRRFVTLAGKDTRGTVEVYGTFPSAGPGVSLAPFALTLDDVHGEQAFFAILTDTRPAPDAVLRAVGAERVALDQAQVATLVIQKE
jgi:Putative zinc-finger